MGSEAAFFIDNSTQGPLELQNGKAASAFILNKLTGGIDVTGEIETEFTLGVTQVDTASAGDDVRVRNGAVLENGVTFLSAGDNIHVESNASVTSASRGVFMFNLQTELDNLSGNAFLDGKISAVDHVKVTGGDRDDTIRINAKTAKVTELDTKGGNDEVKIIGSSDPDSFRFEPQGTKNKVGSLFGPSLVMDNAEKLTIDGKAGGDAFLVLPSSNMEVHINGDAPTSFPGDSLQIDAGGSSYLHAINQRFVTAAGARPVHYSGIESMVVDRGRSTIVGSEASERFIVDATNLQGKVFIILPTGLTVETDEMPAGFEGGGGNDRVEFKLSDQGDDVRFAENLATFNGANVELSGIHAFEVDLGGGNDKINVAPIDLESVTELRVLGGEGNDEFTVRASSVFPIELAGNGGDNTLIALGDVATDGNGMVVGEGVEPISYFEINNINIPLTNVLNVAGTSGDDHLVVNATASDAGTYQLNNGPVKSFSGITVFSFDANSGDDILEINHPVGSIFNGGGFVKYIAEPNNNNADDLLIVAGGKSTRVDVDVDSAGGTANVDFDGNLVIDAVNLHKIDVQMNVDRLWLTSDSSRPETIRLFPNSTDDKVDFKADTGLPFEVEFTHPSSQLLVSSDQGPALGGIDRILVLPPKSTVPFIVSSDGDANDQVILVGGHVTSETLFATAGMIEVTGITKAGKIQLEALNQGVLVSSTSDTSGNRIPAQLQSPSHISIKARTGGFTMQSDTIVKSDTDVSIDTEQDIDISAVNALRSVQITSRAGSIKSSDMPTPSRPGDIDVWSPSIEFDASQNVGLFLNPIQTVADNIEGVASGEFAVINEGDLTVGNAGGPQITGVTAKRTLISAQPARGTGKGKGQLTIAKSVKASDTFNSLILVSSGVFQSQDQDLTIKAGATVENTAGDVVIDVGSDLLAEAGSRISATGKVEISTRSADPTPNRYELRGQVVASQLQLNAGVGDDKLIIDPGTHGALQDEYSVFTTTLSMNTGNDSIQIVDRFGTRRQTLLNIRGDAGQDDFTLDTIGAIGHTVANSSIVGGGIQLPIYTVQYTGIEVLEVNGSAGRDVMTVEPSKETAITLNGRDPSTAPGDRLVIRAPKRELDDKKPNSFKLSGYQTIRLNEFEDVTVVDARAIVGTDADEIITIDISPDGSSTVRFGEEIGGPTFLIEALPISIDGGEGYNEVRFNWLGGDQVFNVSAHEFAILELSAVELIHIDQVLAIGGDGNDIFNVQASLLTPLRVEGGDGDNQLVVSVPDVNAAQNSGEAVLTEGFQPVEYGGLTLTDIVPQPLPREGDLNRDGQIDVKDIDFFYLGLANQTTEAMFDMNLDNVIDKSDATFWVEDIMRTRLGDTDLDGDVDFGDFLKLSQNFGQQGHWSDGNFDGAGAGGNGKIEFADFLLLSSNFGFKRP